MSLLPHFTTSPLPPRTLRMSFTPISPRPFHTTASRPKPTSAELLPARDRVVDFGKHKGRMLGTLPSKYLTWVSNNLRARDFEEWAKLADEVLRDPVYRDRVEWESAERVLSGGGVGSGGSRESPVSALLEISERFGWDNEDKEGWKRVDFELLGTSKGGRIPRRRGGGGGVLEGSGETGFGRVGWETAKERKGETFGSSMFDRERQLEAVDGKRMELQKDGKVGFLSKGHRVVTDEEEEEEEQEEQELELAGGKREERRDRQRIKRDQQMRKLRKEVGVVEGGGGNNGGSGGLSSPFPGRDALLGRIRKKP